MHFDLLSAFSKITDPVFAPSGHRLCASCFLIVFQILHNSFEEDIVGTSEAIRNRKQCGLCQTIYRILLDRVQDPKSPNVNIQSQHDKVLQWTGSSRIWLNCEALNTPRVHIQLERDGDRNLGLNELIWLDANDKQLLQYIHPLTAEQLRPVKKKESIRASGGTRVNVRQIKSWIQTCKSTHGSACNNRQFAGIRHGQDIELYFIDTIDNCLVEGTSRSEYFALSYVWGQGSITKLTRDLLPQFIKKGSLQNQSAKLPTVVLDAMDLVKALGCRYLWVDALCIVQDDPEHKALVIGLMDIIYSHAFLTVVALSGQDSDYPLHGVREATRAPIKHVGWVNGRYLVSTPPQLSTAMKGRVYESRGWTFQERMLSKRCLYFSDYQVYFHCVRQYWEESGASEPFEDYKFSANRAMFLNPLAKLKRYDMPSGHAPSPHALYYTYTDTLKEYSRRSLTFPSDILDAFAGVASVLEQLSGNGETGSMHFGLLSSMIDLCLLWYPITVPTRRRVANQLPSWSWAGWEGQIEFIKVPWGGLASMAPNSLSHAPVKYWTQPDIPEYNFPDTMRTCLKSEIMEFHIFDNDAFQPIWRQPTTMMPPNTWEELNNSGNRSIDLGVEPWIKQSGLPLLLFRAQYVSMHQFQIVVLKRKPKFIPDHCTALFSAEGEKIGCLYGFEEFEDICPRGDNCDKCHYVEVERRDYPLADRLGAVTEKWDLSGYYGEGEHLSPFQHVCLSQEDHGACALILLSSRRGSSIQLGFGDNSVHVMLIRWVGNYAERITVGEVTHDAWNKLSKVEKTIYLG